ncbi:hypothetical protein AA313_de0207409 [Arthrobotrys entomopaga]|nr:hypothetical protein AA313_de0207409 [Arthrobotrys entomopaga]
MATSSDTGIRKSVQRTPEGKISKTRNTKRETSSARTSTFIEKLAKSAVRKYHRKDHRVSLKLSDESIGRIILDRGVPEPGTEHYYVYDTWEAIDANTQAARVWNQNIDDAVIYLSTTTLLWRAMHLGILNGAETISILYEPGGYFNKENEEDHVLRELRLRYFPSEIFPEIEFIEAVVSKGALVDTGNYQNDRILGASIGVGGIEWSAGTLGGFWKARGGNQVFGLSCHHVLLPTKSVNLVEEEEEEEGGAKVLSEFNPPDFLSVPGELHAQYSEGSSVSRINESGVTIVQPACMDHRDTVQVTQFVKCDQEKILSGLLKKHELLGSTPPEGYVDDLKSTIQELKAALLQYQIFDRRFGSLAYTSGYRVDAKTRHSLDWGVFRLVEGSKGINKLPAVLGITKGWELLSTVKRITGIADPIYGIEVFKVGRRTGVTFGTISGVTDAVSLTENGCTTREWSVVGSRGIPFAANGDSGSLVLNQALQVVGVLTAGNDALRPFAYFTPIKLVLSDIKEQTGLELELNYHSKIA